MSAKWEDLCRGWGRTLALAGVVGLLLLGTRVACRPHPLGVTAIPVGLGPAEDVVTNRVAGTIQSRARRPPRRRAHLVGGPLRFAEGARVRRGDVIVELDPSTARGQLTDAYRDADALDAAHKMTLSAERLVRQSWDRVERLHREGVVSAVGGAAGGAALAVALGVGLVAGVAPAVRASR